MQQAKPPVAASETRKHNLRQAWGKKTTHRDCSRPLWFAQILCGQGASEALSVLLLLFAGRTIIHAACLALVQGQKTTLVIANGTLAAILKGEGTADVADAVVQWIRRQSHGQRIL